MEYSFREVMNAMKRFVKVNNVSGSIFAATSFDQMMNQTEEFEAKIMEWAKEHPEPRKKTWGEALTELGLLNRHQVNDIDAFHTVKELELRKEVPDELFSAIEQHLKDDKEKK